jgi:LysM repeat protein
MNVWTPLARMTDSLAAAAYVMRHYEMPAIQTDANARHRRDLGVQAIGAHGAKPTPPTPPGIKWVIVKSGDTLSGISKANRITLAALLKLNPGIKNPNLIYPGQKIRVK